MYYNHDLLDSSSPVDRRGADEMEHNNNNLVVVNNSNNSSFSASDWASRITQFNPFYDRDKYERVPEPSHA